MLPLLSLTTKEDAFKSRWNNAENIILSHLAAQIECVFKSTAAMLVKPSMHSLCAHYSYFV